MSGGFIAYNNSNQVIVSQDFKNLHLWGKAAYQSQVYVDGAHGGCQRWLFWTNCPQYPVPFFSMPNSGAYYGISRIYGTPGSWYIEIISGKTGGNLAPNEVYVFSNPVTYNGLDNTGLLVYSNDGSPSFDSRMSPLSVIGALNVSMPSGVSETGGGSLGSSPNWTSNAVYSYSAPFLNGVAKPIYSYATIAQTAKEYYFTVYNEMCNLYDGYGGCIDRAWTRYEHWYWAFWRGGINMNANTINTSWITTLYGDRYQETGNSGFLGGGNSASGGSWPYNGETLNMQSSVMLCSNGALYD